MAGSVGVSSCTSKGCRFDPGLMFLSLSLPLPLKSINIHSAEDGKKMHRVAERIREQDPSRMPPTRDLPLNERHTGTEREGLGKICCDDENMQTKKLE